MPLGIFTSEPAGAGCRWPSSSTSSWLVDEDELVLRGMNVRWHQTPGRVVGLKCKRRFGPCAIPVGVAKDLPLAAILRRRHAYLKRARASAFAHLVSPPKRSRARWLTTGTSLDWPFGCTRSCGEAVDGARRCASERCA